jgi:flagellar hook-associated protein 1 FlgK
MAGLFGNLIQASKALVAHQTAITVTGRNLANINNPEYARQRVNMGDRFVNQTPRGPEGTGVEVLEVQQLRDVFLDRQVVRQAADNGFLEAHHDALSGAEVALGDRIDRASDPASITDTELSPTGIGAALDQFFNDMSALSTTPADVATRNVALESARVLVDRINIANERMDLLTGDLEDQIDADLTEANQLLEDIARLNVEIRQADSVMSGGGGDLIDKRQVKLERLSRLVKIDVTPEPDSPTEVNIRVGGKLAVTYGMLQGELSYAAGKGIQWTDGTAIPVTISLKGGKAQGRYAALAGGGVSIAQTRLQALADALRVKVNSIYNSAGASGADFFLDPGTVDPNNYDLIALRSDLSAMNLATSSTGNAGDNQYIRDIAGLRTSPVSISVVRSSSSTTNNDARVAMEDVNGLSVGMGVSGSGIAAGTTISAINTGVTPPVITLSASATSTITGSNALTFSQKATLLDYTRSMVTELASYTQGAGTRLEEVTVLETALKTQRDSVSAVSLDEETADLLRFQKAYQANAKVISVIDDMLNSLISMIR